LSSPPAGSERGRRFPPNNEKALTELAATDFDELPKAGTRLQAFVVHGHGTCAQSIIIAISTVNPGDSLPGRRRASAIRSVPAAYCSSVSSAIAIGIAYINDIEHDRRNPPSPDFVAQLAAVLGVPQEVLRYYAGRLPSDKETGDPSHEQIVAAKP
jgi:hypothetical protein